MANKSNNTNEALQQHVRSLLREDFGVEADGGNDIENETDVRLLISSLRSHLLDLFTRNS